ncbi:MAG: zinc carboxypeptidase [Halobacteriovoraceae bacterium]|nr:zinc carboxypeptidase [Halobacteriovoraceae bacterium]MCB9094083.1 zinc carboxypeptidase [Halobacteriovoraceae bacterium]
MSKRFVALFTFSVLLFSCNESATTTLSLFSKTNNPVSGNPGGRDPAGGSTYCFHPEADNYSQKAIGTDPENCLFKVCLDPLKQGYSVDKILEYQKYIDEKNGYILNEDSKCGGSNKDGSSTVQFPNGFGNYHTYQEFTQKIKEYNNKYPETSKIVVMGKSHEGRPILGLRISHKDNIQENQTNLPIFAIFGTHHAREHLSTEVPLLMIEFILDKMKTDETFNELLKSREIYVFPMINPDGTLHDVEGGLILWRKNYRPLPDGQYGVDLNRNYSYGFGGPGASGTTSSDVYRGPFAFSEPETQAVKDFVESKDGRIKTMITFHSFSELILYPWGGTTDKIDGRDFDVFKTMADTMAGMNGYTPMQASGLYVASGDTCDWAYADHKIFCMTFELTPNSGSSAGFYPRDTVINSVFQDNQAPMLYMIENTDDPYKVLP